MCKFRHEWLAVEKFFLPRFLIQQQTFYLEFSLVTGGSQYSFYTSTVVSSLGLKIVYASLGLSGLLMLFTPWCTNRCKNIVKT